MRYFWQFSIVAIACLISIGCAPITQPPRETITFDYTPTTEAPPGSADVSFAIVGTQFVVTSNNPQNMSPQQSILLPSDPMPFLFRRLVSNMTKDLEEVLAARGFNIKGSFPTLDEMIYPDKEGSDLILTAKVKFRVNRNTIRYTQDMTKPLGAACGLSFPILLLMRANYDDYKYNPTGAVLTALGYMVLATAGSFWVIPGDFVPDGQVQVSSEISLEAYEGLTNEIMWSKKIPIPAFTIKPQNKLRKKPDQTTWQELMKIDNKFYSDMGRAFEGQYDKILNQIYIYLDPREMAIVKNQAMELRRRKVY